ncbi:hypothetical protein E8E13_006452 [Curvularia kusanoi]|uniref:Uncharacterized protein n=1 Tax=Curvularia kusanoi TaxID=90978 RepID=A0A9P4TBU5_CURKU|nr:hypothetical protein E8E13_006452 [Curvularia kusanoi]
MALRRQNLSPTANLLRNSRLFSLPNPLPRPVVGETIGAGITKASDSATLPYPTHQAIATTKSSLARGDWGLKRNLPSRSRVLQTSDPVLRITQLDTIEDVTDFDSAADHVRTRQKWEQMGVPMMKGMQQMGPVDRTGVAPTSAFERRDDTTAYHKQGLDESGLFLQALKNHGQARKAEEKRSGSPQQFSPFTPPPVDAELHNTRRWKHDGPWLPGQSAEEFVSYISREISKRRESFNAVLIEFVKNEIYTTRQLAASQSGETPPVDPAEAQAWQKSRQEQWANISDDDITAGIKALRKETANNPVSSKLVQKLIVPFLRLPTIRIKATTYGQDASKRDFEKLGFDQESAPLSTHPSAGLGYLRTKAYLSTHPILGPQLRTAPVPSRVLQPRQTGYRKENYARLGVAGFVANDAKRATDVPNSARRNAFQDARDVETIDITTPGGKKILVNPQFGSVSNDGRIHIKIERSDGAEVAVARGELEDKPPVRAAEDQMADVFPSRNRGGFKGFAGRGKRSGIKQLDELTAAGRRDEGVKELDESSQQAKQFAEMIQSPAKGQPGPGFPGLADALRPEEK